MGKVKIENKLLIRETWIMNDNILLWIKFNSQIKYLLIYIIGMVSKYF